MEMKTLILDDFHRGEYSKYSLHVLPAWRISERIELFAGPAFNFVDTNTPWGKALFANPIWENGYGNGHLRQWYVGGMGGVSFLRSEERRVGKACVSTCRSRGSQEH